MYVHICIRAGDPRVNNAVETGHCIMVFVASDEAGYPVAVPSWVSEQDYDKKLEQYAIRAKEFAQMLDKDLLAATDSE